MIAVGYGNGLHFHPLNGQMPSFDNTLFIDERFRNIISGRYYYQKYFASDTLVIQVRVGSGDTCTLTYYDDAGASGDIAGALSQAYDSGDFWQFDVSLAARLGRKLYFVAENTSEPTDDLWQSEMIEVVADDDDLLLLEWYGNDAQFGCDYTDFTPFLRVGAVFKDIIPKEDVTVYGNQNEVTKLYHKVSRQIEFKTGNLPRYLVEKIVIASAHDYFFVNEVAFVREEKSEVTNYEGRNEGEIKIVLTQANVLGLNTHDVGFDCETMTSTCKVINMQQEAVSANTTFTIPEDHGLDIITVWYNSGTDVRLLFGTTPAGDEIADVRPSAGDPQITLNVPMDLAKTGTATLYVGVSGTSPDVDIFVRTIQNRE
jgi:hypothetical protein